MYSRDSRCVDKAPHQKGLPMVHSRTHKCAYIECIFVQYTSELNDYNLHLC